MPDPDGRPGDFDVTVAGVIVAGYGAAGKEQVAKMVQARLRLSQPPKPADAADAAALALCHLAVAPLSRRVATASAGAGVRR